MTAREVAWDQLLHDVLAWVAGGQGPHRVPGLTAGQSAPAAERLLSAALITWSRALWAYVATDHGLSVLADWSTAYTPSAAVRDALAALPRLDGEPDGAAAVS